MKRFNVVIFILALMLTASACSFGNQEQSSTPGIQSGSNGTKHTNTPQDTAGASIPPNTGDAQSTPQPTQAQAEVISEFTTSFADDPYNAENRVANVVKAAGLVDGAKLEPGESFDTNATLGDRNGENGWHKAPGIRNGKYNMEYGGGVCQVSSTLYNAALMANLEIVERHPHSWPVGYVPIGRDATISTDGPNLIFKNSTGAPVTIECKIDDTAYSVTVRIIGTPSTDYASIELESEKTATIPAPATEYVADSSLAPGEERIDRKARDGSRAVTYMLFLDENGEVIEKRTVSEDTYKAIAGRVLQG